VQNLTLLPSSGNSGQFTITSDCPASLPSGVTCHISVTFSPVNAGNALGWLFINSSGGNRSIALNGTGDGPIAQYTYSDGFISGSLPNTIVGTYAKPKLFTLKNIGQYPMDLSPGFQLAPPFFQTNDCPLSLEPGASCHFQVTAKPDHIGSFWGFMYMPKDAQAVQLLFNVNGFDIDMAVSRPSRPSRNGTAVSTGQTAAYRVTLSPSGPTNSTAVLACSGAPIGVSCEVQPSVVSLGSGPVDVNVVVGVAGSPVQQSRSLRLRNVLLENAASKSFNLNMSATVGAASRNVQIPVTMSTSR
jgi:hypothetical protein